MIYLVLLLLISHGIVLFLLKKYIEAYKTNNHNYINKELQTLNHAFSESVRSIGNHVDEFSENTHLIFTKLEQNHERFNDSSKEKVSKLTSFIKSDYRSLTELVKTNNDLLSKLIKKTEENITKNQELKPLLQNSSEELEKIYSKIKLLISSYEKSLKDIKIEVQDIFSSIETATTAKVKQLAAGNEKTMTDAVEISKSAVQEVVTTTNKQLKNILEENQIAVLTSKVGAIEIGLAENLKNINESISELDRSLVDKLNTLKKDNKNKKGFLGF